MLLQVQRSYVISSDESDDVLTDNAATIAHMDDDDKPMVRMFALGKVSKTMRNFLSESSEVKLSENEKRLLKGFYTANKNEIEGKKEDALERIGHQADLDKASEIMEKYWKLKEKVDVQR